jgi:hypothetical protein
MEWLIAVLLTIIAGIGGLNAWLIHVRIPKKKPRARSKPKPKPEEAPVPAKAPVKRHRAVTAEELQEREISREN